MTSPPFHEAPQPGIQPDHAAPLPCTESNPNIQSAPWKDHLFALEPTLQPPAKVLYVLYPEGDEPGSKWRIQCVPESSESFINRKSMPEAWRGVRDADLSKVSGIEGCVFCHASGFIGGNETYEGALKMARESLKA
jgi:uncharacterized UPF0160 family protein